MKKVIIFSLLLLCLLASPGLAWEQTFEEHPSDIDESYITSPTFTKQIITSGYGLKYDNPLLTHINITQGWGGYLGFTAGEYYTTDLNGNYQIGLVLFNSSGSPVFSNLNMVTVTRNQNIARIEFMEEQNGIISCYKNGTLIGTTEAVGDTYSATKMQITEAVGDTYSATKMQIYISKTKNLGCTIDDITTEFYSIGCKPVYTQNDNVTFFSYGYPKTDSYNTWIKLISPSGTVLNTWNVSTDPAGLFTWYTDLYLNESGTYSFRMFGQDTLFQNSPVYVLKTHTFTYNIPSAHSISLDKEEYSPGNILQIFSHVSPYSSGYKVTINYRTSSGTQSYTYDLLEADYTKNFQLPPNAQGGSYFVYLLDPNDNVVAYDYYQVSAPLGTTSLILDKSIYENNDTIKITYQNMPENTRIDLYLKSGSTRVFTTNWGVGESLSGSGVKTFNISGRAADSVYVTATKGDIFEGTLLGEASAKILAGEYFLSGKIYDSSTNTPISGATIYVGGSSAVTNALGYYETTVLAGTQPVSIVKDGYNQYTGNVQVYSLSTSRNFYLVKTISSGGNTLYGTVTDYYTGAPLNSTYIQIKNGSTVYSMLTHSKTGNYLFDQEGLSGSWEVTVTKTGYDTHTQTVTISGDTYLSIKLVPVGGSSSIPDDDSSGSGSSNSSADRPSREAAKDSLTWLESTMPNLIKLVVVVFVLALIGWRF